MRAFFFYAIIPPDPIAAEVTKFKEEASALFNARRALNSPPHITIIPPFTGDNEILAPADSGMEEICQFTLPVKLHLNGFNAFKPRVIFIQPEANERLDTLYRESKERLGDFIPGLKMEERPFHPHMTIAFKDLSGKMFGPAWEHFRKIKYSRSWEVTSLSRLQFREKKWEVVRTFPFLGKE